MARAFVRPHGKRLCFYFGMLFECLCWTKLWIFACSQENYSRFFFNIQKKTENSKIGLTNHKKNPVVFVTIGISALSWAFLSGNITLGNVVAPDVSNFWYLIILIGVGTYFISSGFFGVYAMAVDTTFICFCEDLERNNGQDKPYFMSKSLLKVLGKKNKTVKLK